jgi:hypothetical protein
MDGWMDGWVDAQAPHYAAFFSLFLFPPVRSQYSPQTTFSVEVLTQDERLKFHIRSKQQIQFLVFVYSVFITSRVNLKQSKAGRARYMPMQNGT